MPSSGVFLCFDSVSTRDNLSHVEGHHEISTSYLNAIELLPIWIIFIDRIIVRIWFSVVTLSIELLNLAQIEPYCRVVVECDSLLSAQNSVIERYPQRRRPYIIR